MKVKVFFILTVAMLFLSACSGSRFGHIPKGKRQKHVAKKEAKKWKKQNQNFFKIEAVKAIPQKLNTKPIIKIVEAPNLPAAIAPSEHQNQIKKAKPEQQQLNEIEKIENINKKTATKQLQKTNDFDFWEGFWGELVAEIIAAIIILALAAFFVWLEAIGLGWLVVVIGLALLVLIIVLIGRVIQDFFDMVFS